MTSIPPKPKAATRDGNARPDYPDLLAWSCLILIGALLAFFVWLLLHLSSPEATAVVGAALVMAAGLAKVGKSVDRVSARVKDVCDLIQTSAGLVGGAIAFVGVVFGAI